MKKYLYKGFFSDIDGTYVTNDEETPEKNVVGMRYARRKGLTTGFLTGRQYFTSRDIAKEAQAHYLGTDNGAVVFALQGKKYELLSCVPINFALCHEAVQELERLRRDGKKVVYHVSSAKKFIVKKGTLDEAWYKFYPQERLLSKKEKVFQFDDFAWDMQQHGLQEQIVKICADFLGNVVEAGKFKMFLQQIGLSNWETAPGKLEISAIAAGKVQAIKRILRFETKRGNIILPQQVAFFGDNWNDEKALKFCGLPCIVQNAPTELKDTLKNAHVIGPNWDGAVGETIISILGPMTEDNVRHLMEKE